MYHSGRVMRSMDKWSEGGDNVIDLVLHVWVDQVPIVGSVPYLGQYLSITAVLGG